MSVADDVPVNSQDYADRERWRVLLHEVKSAHQNSETLEAFCPFPDDIREQDVTPRLLPPATLFDRETALISPQHGALRDAAMRCAGQAWWRLN